MLTNIRQKTFEDENVTEYPIVLHERAVKHEKHNQINELAHYLPPLLKPVEQDPVLGNLGHLFSIPRSIPHRISISPEV